MKKTAEKSPRRSTKILNKKGLHNFYILENLEVGIKLLGHEVKSLRAGRAELGDAHAKIIGSEIFLVNAHIPPYQNAFIKDYVPTRSRKLLLHKNQITSLIGKINQGGITLIPVSIYEKHNLFKVDLGLGKSKKQYDKRKLIKERDHNRRIEQELRGKE